MTTRTLLLLRHAKSSWEHSGLADHERPLAPRGQRAAPAMAAWLARHGPVPESVLCSDAVRALETWSLVEPALVPAPEVVVTPELYGADVTRLLHLARATASGTRSLLLVGHNPGLHELALALAGEAGDPADLRRLEDNLPTAGLVRLEFESPAWDDLEEGAAQLTAFMAPKLLPHADELRL
jgi:phosphohistidine phosphatase